MQKIIQVLFLFMMPYVLLSQNSLPCKGDTCKVFMDRDQARLKRVVIVKNSSKSIYTPIGNRCYGYGYSDTNILIPIQFDIAKPFCNGYAVVVLNKKVGIIDSLGKVVVPIKYAALSNVYEGVAFFSMKGEVVEGCVDMNGKEHVLDPLVGGIPVSISQNIMTAEYFEGGSFVHDDVKLLPYRFSEGLAVLYYKKVINKEFKYVFTSTYHIEDCINGMLRVSWKSSTGNTLYGFLDKNGVLAVKPIYLSAENFVDGKSMVTSGNPHNPVSKIIDKNGVVLKVLE